MAKIFQLPSIERTSAADQVTSILRERILSGELSTGTPLPEVQMASTMQVSRNTIREAMRTLTAEGLVKHNVHRGVTVAALDVEDVAEIFRVRRMLELAAVKAARNKPLEAFAPLKDTIEKLKRAVAKQDWSQIVEHDMNFHRLLVRFLNSPRLEHFYWMLLSELRLGFAAIDRSADKPPEHIVLHHQRLLNFMQKGSLEQCVKMLQTHLNDAELRLCSMLHDRNNGRNSKD